MTRTLLTIGFLSLTMFVVGASAADWIHWRGPEQTGRSRDRGLPETFGITTPGEENLLWRAPIGGRSTPLILDGRLYMITAGVGEGVYEHERVVCLNADTGKLEWEQPFGVFHTDIVSSRLGWTTLTADPVAKTIFCHGTQGSVFCFDAKTGAIRWERNLTEEFGRITGYGGRIVSPIFDHHLVIIGMISSGWGNQARGANRFVALEASSGKVIWWSELPAPIKGTYYSNPIIANINGERLLITGGGDGGVHALKVRNGQLAWSYMFSAGVVNPSPVLDGTRVYISHGEENPEGGPIGRVICLDAGQVDPKTKKPKLVWEVKNLSKRFGLASGAIADGIYYVPDDSSELVAFDAANGNVLWRHKYGTFSRGAPLIADNKLYIFDVNGIFTVLGLKGKKKPEVLEKITFRPKSGVGFLETHGTPICVNGRLYFCTREDTYCITDLKGTPTAGTYPPEPEEKAVGELAGLRVQPAEVTALPGETVTLSVKFVDASGRLVTPPTDAKVEWTILPPPAPPGAKTEPPPLKALLSASGDTATLELDRSVASQHGYVVAKFGKLTSAWTRIRVAATDQYANDFERIPEGVAPAGWVTTSTKFAVKQLEGNKVLSKVNNDSRPPFARSNAFITPFTAKNYVIACDVLGTEVRGKLPDMGVVNSRYSLVLDGKADSNFSNKRTLRIIAWEALPRINHAVEFDWQPNQWYRLKLALQPGEKTTRIVGKAWKRGEPEPQEWTITFDDPNPYREGAAALYGYVANMLETEKDTPMGRVRETLPGSEIYYDNLSITPAK